MMRIVRKMFRFQYISGNARRFLRIFRWFVYIGRRKIGNSEDVFLILLDFS